MISVTDLRPGTKVKMDGGLWECVEYQHQKLGRGGAKVVAKFKNLETGATVERTFNSGEKLEDIYVETRELQYLYPEGEEMVFMDLETYEQFAVPRSRVVGAEFFKEGMTALGDMYEGQPIKVTPPTVVELKVVDTPPGVRGTRSPGGPSPPPWRRGPWSRCPFSWNPERSSRWTPGPASTWAGPRPPGGPPPLRDFDAVQKSVRGVWGKLFPRGAPMTPKELKQILQALVEHGVNELTLETPDYKLTVRRGGEVQVVGVPQVQAPVLVPPRRCRPRPRPRRRPRRRSPSPRPRRSPRTTARGAWRSGPPSWAPSTGLRPRTLLPT